MSSQPIYLYCFTNPETVRDLRLRGIDQASVGAVGRADVSGVYSVAAEKSAEELEARFQDPQWVMARACDHERIVETVMGRGAVVPVRFGTMFSSAGALEATVRNHRPRIAETLQTMADKEEWSVKGFVDDERATEWLLRNDPDLGNRQASLPSQPGARYFQEKRLRQEASRRAKQTARTSVEHVSEALTAVALETRSLKAQPQKLTGRTEPMILNKACLVRGSAVEALCNTVAAHRDACREQGVTIELTGPWPPYSFCPSLDDPSG